MRLLFFKEFVLGKNRMRLIQAVGGSEMVNVDVCESRGWLEVSADEKVFSDVHCVDCRFSVASEGLTARRSFCSCLAIRHRQNILLGLR